jgi:hypothetical protein
MHAAFDLLSTYHITGRQLASRLLLPCDTHPQPTRRVSDAKHAHTSETCACAALAEPEAHAISTLDDSAVLGYLFSSEAWNRTAMHRGV